MKNSNSLLILTIVLFITVKFYGQKVINKEPKEITIQEAINKKMLELKIVGAYDPNLFFEVIDRDGVHFGKCMAVVLRSKIDSLIVVRLDDGIQLIPDDSSIQTMIVTKKALFPLYPNETYSTRFYAMCGEIHDDIPTIDMTFKIGELGNKRVVALAKYLDENYMQNMIGQHALWAITDQTNIAELKKYGADKASISKTNDILNKLKLVTKLNPEQKSKKESETKIISMNLYYLYIGIGAIIILVITITVLIFINRKQQSI